MEIKKKQEIDYRSLFLSPCTYFASNMSLPNLIYMMMRSSRGPVAREWTGSLDEEMDGWELVDRGESGYQAFTTKEDDMGVARIREWVR